MLLRSSSTPILRSWLPPHHINTNTNTNSSPNNIHEPTPCLSRTTSSYSVSPHSPSSSPSSHTPNINHSRRPTCTLFEFDLLDPPYPRTTPLQRLFSSSGLDEAVSVSEEGDGSEGGGVDGKGIDGGDGHGGGGSGFNDYSSNYSNEHGIEAYYQKMIKANPGDPLLLGNYAKFLKDVRGDLAKAEEYCGRAILASPADANMLSMYAEIIWQHRRDTQRAESYFDQATKAAPENCYIHASYAKFLWDMEEEEVEVEVEENQVEIGNPVPLSPPYMEGIYRSPSRI